MNSSSFCNKPYKFFEIGTDGNCYFCCQLWNDSYCIGNILEQNFQDIWNGEKAVKFRQSIIDNEYQYCDLNICLRPPSEFYNSPIADYPEEVSLCYDNTCVQQCVYCRDHSQIMRKKDQLKWDALIEPVFIPMLQKAKLVIVNVAGEVFISEHSKKLIKRIAQVYPDIKFAIITNGILCNEDNLNKLGIADKIVDIRISFPSCIKKTYKKIVRNGNFDKVMNNLKYVSGLKKQGIIDVFQINCVLSSLNYKDLIPLTRLCDELNACLNVMIVKDSGQGTKFLKQIDKYLITSPSHPEYNNFVKIMNNPVIKNNPNLYINDTFRKLEPIPFYNILKNKIQFTIKYGFKKD